MGVVYRGKDENLGDRDVAIKVLPPGALGDESARERFRNEAVALSKLTHPNIGIVHHFGTENQVDYLVMEYIPGLTLRGKLDERPLSEREISRLGEQLAEGIASAHDRHVLHRDLKPRNIMVTPEGHLKILDFGLAKLMQPDTLSDERTKSFAGTFPYMAPEQINGDPADRRTDIYAAGNVLYEMATGRRPFEKPSARNILLDAPPTPSSIREGISPRLEEIVLRCLEKDPEDRYQSAKDLAIDLRHLRSTDFIPQARDNQKHSKSLKWKLATVPVLILIALMLQRYWPFGIGSDEIPQAQPLPVTRSQAWEGQPALSPAGSRIAYVSDENDNLDIYVTAVKGGNQLRITDSEGSDEHPAWFPDESAIAFTSDRSGIRSIWKTGQLGGGCTLLVPNAERPAISPDGQRIAFSRLSSDGQHRIGVARLSNPSDTRIITSETDGLWDHLDPTWSPDGNNLCYSSRHNLWIVPAEGGEARRVLADGELDFEPAWSPDGRHIYFASFRGETVALWRVHVRGGTPERITIGTGPESHPSISRTGTRMAYASGSALFGNELVIRNREIGEEVTLQEFHSDIFASFSPDNSQIVYSATRGEAHHQLWLQNLQNGVISTEPYKLTDEIGTSSCPTFSPNGEWIAYYRVIDEQRDIWIIPSSGGQSFRLTDNAAMDLHPAWSPDSSKIAFASNREEGYCIWMMSLRQGRRVGKPRRITEPPLSSHSPSWSKDGSKIAFIGVEGSKAEVWVVPSDGGDPARQVTDGAEASRIHWDPTSDQLLASGAWGGERFTLRTISLEMGEAEELSPPIVFGLKTAAAIFDISPDGKFLIFTRQNLSGDIWVMDAQTGVF